MKPLPSSWRSRVLLALSGLCLAGAAPFLLVVFAFLLWGLYSVLAGELTAGQALQMAFYAGMFLSVVVPPFLAACVGIPVLVWCRVRHGARPPRWWATVPLVVLHAAVLGAEATLLRELSLFIP